MKKTNIMLLIILCAYLMVGCTSNEQVNANTTIAFTDSVGREVEIPLDPERVVVTGPLAQMMVFAIAPDKLVGLASSWDASAEGILDENYLNLPVLGRIYGSKGDLNVETIISENPDLIIDMGEYKDSIKDDMDSLQEQLNIPVIHITTSFSTNAEGFTTLGKALNMEEDGAVLSEYLEGLISEVENVMDKVGDKKPKLLYALGDKGLNVIAKDSYHAEVIDFISDNAAALENPVSKGTGNEVDLEQMLNFDPDIMLFAPDSIYDTVKEDELWQEVRAVKDNQVYEVPVGPENFMGFPPSVQRYLGLAWLGELLYPDMVTYDLQEVITEYYELFYHTELGENQYNELMKNSLPK